MVHPSCRPVCHLSEPQGSIVCISSPRPKCLGHRCSEHNWSGLTAYAYPPTAFLYRVIPKIRQCSCHIIVIAPGWPGLPWFWYLVQLSSEIPLIAKNQLAREGSPSVSPVTIPALTTIMDRQFKEDRTLCHVRSLRYYLDPCSSFPSRKDIP